MSVAALSPDTGPLPVVAPVEPYALPAWFSSLVLRNGAYAPSTARLRAEQRDCRVAGDHLMAAVLGEAVELRSRYRSDAAATVAVLEMYWPVGRRTA